MQIKLLFTVLIFLCLGCQASGQDSCFSNSYKQILRVIEKAIPINSDNYKCKKSEFFVISIVLNESGQAIKSIGYLKENNSLHFSYLDSAIEKIKHNWKNSNCQIKRILIPVLIYFDDVDDFNYFDLLQSNMKSGLFVAKTIYIPVSPRDK